METLARNYNNRNEAACLYELASVYLPTEEGKLPDERLTLICGMYGPEAGFFAAKGMVEALLERLGADDWEIEACSDEPAYHPGRCGRLSLGGEPLGVLGELHPKTAENYGMDCRTVSFSLDVDTLYRHTKLEKTYAPLPKFPAVSRDLALVCGELGGCGWGEHDGYLLAACRGSRLTAYRLSLCCRIRAVCHRNVYQRQNEKVQSGEW